MAQIENSAGLVLLSRHTLLRDREDTSASNDKRSQISSPPSSPRPVQQDFENESAPVPLQQSTNAYIFGHNNTNSTYLMDTVSWDNSPLLEGSKLNSKRAALLKSAEVLWNSKTPLGKRPKSHAFPYLAKRAEVATQCGPGKPCADGSCCSKGYVNEIFDAKLWLKESPSRNTCGYGVRLI